MMERENSPSSKLNTTATIISLVKLTVRIWIQKHKKMHRGAVERIISSSLARNPQLQ